MAKQNTNNTIGDIPSVKLHQAPGGSSSVFLGGPTENIAAPAATPAMDRSDTGALQILAELNEKHRTTGKLAVRDFHLIASCPLFEHVYTQHQISRLRYADKVNATGGFLKALNEQFGAAEPQHQPAPAQPVATPDLVPHATVPLSNSIQAPQPFVAPVAPMDIYHAVPQPEPTGMQIDMQAEQTQGTRTASRGGGAGGMQNVGNSIGDVPSVKLHAPPGGGSSISFGTEIDTNAVAAQTDRSDTAALAFLQEATIKLNTGQKLSIRDFHMLGSFPLFESVYQSMGISRMSYAEKINVASNFLKSLNTSFSVHAAPVSCAAMQTRLPQPMAPQQHMYGSGVAQRTASRGGGAGGMQNVGNSIGDIPSVRLHAPPGGGSSIAFG